MKILNNTRWNRMYAYISINVSFLNEKNSISIFFSYLNFALKIYFKQTVVCFTINFFSKRLFNNQFDCLSIQIYWGLTTTFMNHPHNVKHHLTIIYEFVEPTLFLIIKIILNYISKYFKNKFQVHHNKHKAYKKI